MILIYYWFKEERADRPGGPWWHQEVPSHQTVDIWLTRMKPLLRTYAVIKHVGLAVPTELPPVIHGGNENRCVADERKPEYDFTCVFCHRRICWCFGSGCSNDDKTGGEDGGICCGCHEEHCGCDE